MNRRFSIFAPLLACLLALLVGSPLCCCAAEPKMEQATKCCCCSSEGSQPKPAKKKDTACLCESKAPRDLPEATLPPGPPPELASLAPLEFELLPVPTVVELASPPHWQPGRPWHAPPAQLRALLVSRTL